MASKGHRPPPTHTIRCTAPGCGQQVNVSRTEPPEIPRVEMHRHRGAMCGAVGQPICPGGCGITEAERHPRRANEWRCVNCKLSWSDDPVNAAAAESVKHYSPPPGSGAAHNLPDEPLAVIEVDVRPNRAPYGYGQHLIFEGALWLLGVNCKLKEKPGDHLDEFELNPAGRNGSRVSLTVARKLLDLGARRPTQAEVDAGGPFTLGERMGEVIRSGMAPAAAMAQITGDAIREAARPSTFSPIRENDPAALTARAATLRAEGTALLAKADRLEAAAKMIEQAEEMIKNDD